MIKKTLKKEKKRKKLEFDLSRIRKIGDVAQSGRILKLVWLLEIEWLAPVCARVNE